MLTWAMHLTLCLPGLLLPRQALHDTVYDLTLPALSRLLGAGRLTRTPPGSLMDWLAAHWGWAELPAAALRLAGNGLDPGNADWLCLDPVHLKVGRDGVRIDNAGSLNLDTDEDTALLKAMAPLFAAIGEMVGTTPGCWHLRLDRPTALTTTPPVPGSGVDPALPGGTDGPALRRLLAEAQMALHAHPVNHRREEGGRPTANSLWAWGQGRRPSAAGTPPFDVVHTADPILRGLAACAGLAGKAVPTAFEPLSHRPLVVIDDLAAPALALDAFAWRDALARVERDWCAPLADAIAAGRCRLTLVAHGAEGGLELTVSRGDFWRFWRRPRPLTDLMP